MPQLHPLYFVSCCVAICLKLRNFHFPLSHTCRFKMWKKKPRSLNCLSWWGYFQHLLSIVVLCSLLIIVYNLSRRYESCVPCPPNLPSWPPHSDPRRDFWETKSSLSHLWEPTFVPQAPLQTFPLHRGYWPLCLETEETNVTSSLLIVDHEGLLGLSSSQC